jgi:hypothetical protein
LTWEAGDLKEALIYAIANHMKKCYLNWNKDTVDDAVIFKHLRELSNGEIDLNADEEVLSETSKLVRKTTPIVNNNNNNKNKNFKKSLFKKRQ